MVDVRAVAVVGPSAPVLRRRLAHGWAPRASAGVRGPSASGAAPAVPDVRTTPAPPGRSTRPCPRHRSPGRRPRPGGPPAGRAPPRAQPAAQHPAAQRRRQRGDVVHGQVAVRAVAGAASSPRRARRARRGPRAAGRRAGQRRRDAAAQDVLEQRQHLGAQPRRACRRGRRSTGRPRPAAPARRRRPGSSARRTPSSGRHQATPSVPADHAGHRPGPGSAAEAEQHGLGLVVQGVAEQRPRGPVPRRRRPGPRSGRRGRPPPGPPSAADVDPDDVTGSRPRLRSSDGRARPARPSPAAGRGRR